MSRDLPIAWQQEALPNDPIGTNWVYYEALVVSNSPVYTLTRDNLDPETRKPPSPPPPPPFPSPNPPFLADRSSLSPCFKRQALSAKV